MSADEPVKAVKEGVSLIGELIKVAGDNPKVKEAGGNVADIAVTVTALAKTVLLPIAAINFGAEKARRYFQERFANDLVERAQKLQIDPVFIEPKPSIAGPALQGLAFSHEEPSLKDMYLALLLTAMKAESADDVHPAFAEVLKQMTAWEARLFPAVFTYQVNTIVNFTYSAIHGKDPSPQIGRRHVLNLERHDAVHPCELRVAVTIDNWLRLGLISVEYGKRAVAGYDWVERRPEFAEYRDHLDKDVYDVSFEPGVLTATDFGTAFALAVGIRPYSGTGPEICIA